MDEQGLPVDPREALWAELFGLATTERAKGDGRAMRVLERYRDRLEPAEIARARPLHEDNGA